MDQQVNLISEFISFTKLKLSESKEKKNFFKLIKLNPKLSDLINNRLIFFL